MNEGMATLYVDLMFHSLPSSFSPVISYELLIILTEEETETVTSESLARDYSRYEWKQ